MTDTRKPIAAGTLLVALTACARVVSAQDVEVEGQDDRGPNIVLIMADDLGYGDLSSYGHPTIVTPTLDALAADGLRLTAYYAGDPVCTPSRAALLTGRYAIRSGMTEVEFPNSDHGLPPGETTLAEALMDQGYQTAMVGKWHLGDRSPHLPTEHGFDSYYGLLYSNDMVAPWVSVEMDWVEEAMPPLTLVRDEAPERVVEDQSILTQAYTEEAVARIEGFGADRPYFLYLAYSMPHLPIAAPPSRTGSSAGGLYGDVVETIDWSVGEVLAAIEARGELDETIVVFISDNGPWRNLPERMQIGGVEPWHVGSAGTLRGAKGTTYEGGPRVPAIVKWTGAPREGRLSSRTVSAMDLFASLAAAGGAEGLSGLDGTDLSGFLAGEAAPPGAAEFFYFKGARLEAVRDDRWKLRVARYDEMGEALPEGRPPLAELFDLAEDPSERFDVSARHPEHVARLRARLIAFGEETGAELAVPAAPAPGP